MTKSKLFKLLFILVGVCLSSCNQDIVSGINESNIDEIGFVESSVDESTSANGISESSPDESGSVESSVIENNPVEYNYVQKDGVLSYLISKASTDRFGSGNAAPTDFHKAVLQGFQMLLTECSFNYENCTGKIAVTLSKESVEIISTIREGEKWKTINPLIVTMLSGCMVEYDVRDDLKFVRFAKNEKVPCQIDNRYVVALYYEGEERLLEELKQGIEGKNKRIDYCSASAVEDDDGFLNETIPEPYSIKRFCLGVNLVDADGCFNLSKVNVSYSRIGVLDGDTLTTEHSFFTNAFDKLGILTPLINGDSINYEDFKRVVPDYYAYYQSEAFLGKKDIHFIEHVHEFPNENKSLGHVVYLYEDYANLQNYIDKEPFISEFVSEYDESFFAENDIIIVSGFHSAAKYYELHFEGIFLQSGYLSISLRKDYTDGRRGSTFTVAEISKNDLATLESNYISYPADA